VVKGIEINAYAAELARVTVWIGQIQWMTQHGFSANRKPVLKSLDTIENRDALIVIPEGFNRESTDSKSKAFTAEDAKDAEENQNLSPQSTQSNAEENQEHVEITSSPSDSIGEPSKPMDTHLRGNDDTFKEAEWPEAEFIVGNPPFLGGSKMRRELGDEYTTALRNCYKGRVPGGADLVTYWFAKAHEAIKSGKTLRAGLVTTNSIRGGANRKVLDDLVQAIPIFEAWSDEPWVVDGAAVRVSLVGFGNGGDVPRLDGGKIARINSDLTGQPFNLSLAAPLENNRLVSFQGSQKIGPFDILGELAREFLQMPSNPNGRPNSDVVRPCWNGIDITRRPRDSWIIDFGCSLTESEAALYEAPFEYVVKLVKPIRITNNRKVRAKYWWRHGDPQPAMRTAIKPLARCIVTPHVSKHRLFAWLPEPVLPDKMLIVTARGDNYTFGILHSRFHELWSLRMGTSLEDRPRYTPTTCFETFPFPPGFDLTLRNFASSAVKDFDFDSIATTAKRLDELRNNWLNPPEWIERIPEVVPGYPDRIIAKPGFEADLKKRTLTNLYNARPAWLDNIHKELDAAVAAAYGWDDYSSDMPDEEILARLFTLNQERA